MTAPVQTSGLHTYSLDTQELAIKDEISDKENESILAEVEVLGLWPLSL